MQNSSARGRLDAIVAGASLRSTKVRPPPPRPQRTNQFSWIEPPPSGRISSRTRSGAPRRPAIQARKAASWRPSSISQPRHEMATVDSNHAPGHVRARLGGKQQERPVKLAGRPEAPLRHPLDQRLAWLRLEEGVVQLGLDVARRQRVYPDLVPRPFEGEAFG